MKKTLLQKLVLWIFAIWSAFLVILNALGLFHQLSASLRCWMLGIGLFLASAIFCMLGAILLAKLKKKWLRALCIFALAFLIRYIAWRIFLPKAFSDFDTFARVTKFLFDGDYAFLDGDYWQLWSYQLGFPWFVAQICRLVGFHSDTFCLMLNMAASAACAAVLYLIADRFSPGKPAIVVGLAFSSLVLSISLGTIFTNQNISMLFVLLALLVLAKNTNDWKAAILAGLLLAAANFIRTDIVVFPAAILVGGLLQCRKKPFSLSTCFHSPLFSAILCAAVFFCTGKLLDLAFTTINAGGLGNHCPLYKFAVGLNQESGGIYSQKIANMLFSNPAYIENPALRDAAAKQLIEQELSVGLRPLLGLMLKKCSTLWEASCYNFSMLHSCIEAGGFWLDKFSTKADSLSAVFRICEILQRMVLFAGGTFAAIRHRGKKDGQSQIMWMLAVLAFGAISLVIEVQYRYSFLAMPVYCLLLSEAFKREESV